MGMNHVARASLGVCVGALAAARCIDDDGKINYMQSEKSTNEWVSASDFPFFCCLLFVVVVVLLCFFFRPIQTLCSLDLIRESN